MFKKRALALTAVLALGLIPTLPSYAVTTYASPADLIEDVVEVALTGVTSPTKGDALTEMKGKITLTGDEVFYDGTSIGYWYTEDSSTIYTTEAQADTVVVSDGSNGWEVEPLIFEDILSDVNEDLIENIVPTTTNWNDIIGKYDVTLGNITIPADQWVDVKTGIADDPNAENIITIDVTRVTDTNGLIIVPYLRSNEGGLYLAEHFLALHAVNDKWDMTYTTLTNDPNTLDCNTSGNVKMGGTAVASTPYIRVGLRTWGSHGEGVKTRVFATNINNTEWYYWDNQFSTLPIDFWKIDNPTIKGDRNFGQTGVLYFYEEEAPYMAGLGYKEVFNSFFTTQSSSKKVVGNTTLTKRLAKLSNLAASDTIVFTASGWTVNGLEDLDSYISTSILTEAGQSATMDGAVEIEELNFKVVVPSTLPMVADSEGNVQVASNASIDNKSNAKVKITGLEIEANSESGWTMVDSNPSKTRGDNEFSFGTSLSIGDEIAKGDALEFTYNADLSPAEQGVDSVDLVTLTITLDWAE